MKKFIPCILLLLFACGEPPANEKEPEYIPPDLQVTHHNPDYLNKYAGAYAVELIGDSDRSPERFTLHKDQTAEWAFEKDRKYGNWFTNQDTITIKINGNTGTISETFILQKGRFTEALSGQRYLKPRQ